MAKREPSFTCRISFQERGVPDDIYLAALRLIATRLIERCDDPVRLKQIYNIFGLPYDEKFAQAVRKAEAHEELKKALQVIDGGKKTVLPESGEKLPTTAVATGSNKVQFGSVLGIEAVAELGAAQLGHCGARLFLAGAEAGPRGHQRAAAIEQVSAAISLGDRRPDAVRQAQFNRLSRKRGRLVGPVDEGRAEAVDSRVRLAHAAKLQEKRGAIDRLAGLGAGEDEAGAVARQRAEELHGRI